jgi:hypothetical protein
MIVAQRRKKHVYTSQSPTFSPRRRQPYKENVSEGVGECL